MARFRAKIAHFLFLYIVVAVIAVTVMIPVGLAADDLELTEEVGKGCSPSNVNDTAFTAFSGFRDSVFAYLSSHVTPDNSPTDNAGETENSVYGLAVCRKYLSARECSKCIMEAVTQLKSSCPQSAGGRIYLDGCFLRYENSYFYDEPLDGGNSSNCLSTLTNSSDPQFSQMARTLSTQLITNASANKGYAVGSNGPLYGLAQCWPTVSISDCQTCLNDSRNLLLECIPGSEGRGLQAGCFMRYSNYLFYNSGTSYLDLLQLFAV
jgi:hypothetical protein